MELSLKNREWKEFVIENLFDIKIGKNVDGNKINKSSGKYAYITRKESNNGLDGFIDAIAENTILEVVRSGVSGIARGEKVLTI